MKHFIFLIKMFDGDLIYDLSSWDSGAFISSIFDFRWEQWGYFLFLCLMHAQYILLLSWAH